eukprot:g5984.t1
MSASEAKVEAKMSSEDQDAPKKPRGKMTSEGGAFADDKLDGLFAQAMRNDEKKLDLSKEE